MPEAYAESYEVVIRIHLDGNQWGAVVGKSPIEGVAGFGYTVNEAMVDLTHQMEFYHRNWEEFANPD
jgi:predicted RNase H-like HicB family nuclease